jgi:hypothetical protein
MKINRNLFTDRQRTLVDKLETIADYALAIAIGLALAIGALHYFDVLTK